MSYTAGPATKVLAVLVVLGGLGSLAWNLYGKARFGSSPVASSPVAQGQAGSPTPSKEPAVTPAVAAAHGSTGGLGTSANPLKVSLVSFHGYAPALIANGNSLKTVRGSIFDRLGLTVEFTINDDIPPLGSLFESKAAHCAWRTSDFWAQEHPNLRNSGHDAQGIMLVDNTRGADAVITADPSIKRIEDLAGKSVALVQYTPSHGMLIDAIDNSSMTARAKQSVKFIFIKPEAGTPEVRATLVARNADAAALWDPDLSLAMRDAGAHVVYSTRAASNLIYDLITCDIRELSKPQNDPVFQKFVDGWMEGIAVAKADPDKAVDALIATEDLFKNLAAKEGKGFIKALFGNLLLTDVAENARILGLSGDASHYDRVYGRFDQIYRVAGALANPKSPVIPPSESFNLRFIKNALSRSGAAQKAAVQPAVVYTEQERKTVMAAPAQLTKPVYVSFASGSSELTKRAQQAIDKEMVPFIENNGGAYFELSGNTDSVGSAAANMALSQQRVKSVLDYLDTQWQIPRARFRPVGYGSSRPLCNEADLAGAGMSLEECRSLNRSTRIAVYSR